MIGRDGLIQVIPPLSAILFKDWALPQRALNGFLALGLEIPGQSPISYQQASYLGR